jgi:hypothetical protein
MGVQLTDDGTEVRASKLSLLNQFDGLVKRWPAASPLQKLEIETDLTVVANDLMALLVIQIKTLK